MLALAVTGASPALAGTMRDCVARGAADHAACRANSAIDPRRLGQAIAALRGGNNSALRTEIDANARLTAETGLIEDSSEPGPADADAAFMRALESQPVSIGSRIRRLRAGSANAAASALSGNAFRADSTFNLTGHVGSYGGTRAAAIQMGTPIADRMALNAGVTKGFNKVRETVGRVGITLGW